MMVSGTGFTEFTIDFHDIDNVYVGSGAAFSPDDLKLADVVGIQLIIPSDAGEVTVYIDDVQASR